MGRWKKMVPGSGPIHEFSTWGIPETQKNSPTSRQHDEHDAKKKHKSWSCFFLDLLLRRLEKKKNYYPKCWIKCDLPW